MTMDDLARARELLRDPDAEDCERFSSRYGAALLTIAARVLDEGAVEGLARVIREVVWRGTAPIPEGFTEEYRDEARAVLAYLKGEVE